MDRKRGLAKSENPPVLPAADEGFFLLIFDIGVIVL